MDPTHIRRNPLPPPVVIESLIAGDRAYGPGADQMLPKRTTSLHIGNVGLSLTMAEKTKYRCMLDGADAGWQDVQGRRQAFYTNLSPGPHRFRVAAANNDRIWNETGATLDFVIPPTFTQTRCFVAPCAAGAVLVVWLAIRLRVRQGSVRRRGRFTERTAERERIASERHDTLLQSTQGFILRFQVVANRMAPHDPTRDMLDDALKRAGAVMAEGRDRVFDLRVAADPQGELPEAFAATGDQLAQTLEAGYRPDHWGLQGMRERALRMGAKFALWSRPGAGTEIELQIPAAAAYPRRTRRPRWWTFRRLARGGR